MGSERTTLNREAARFFMENAVPALYYPRSSTPRDRWGAVPTNAKTPKSFCVDVIPEFNPTVEMIEAFGHTAEFQPGTRVIAKVLRKTFGGIDVDLGASLELDGKRYNVLGWRPYYRGHDLFRQDVLLGYE
jgi:hypothetical protein